jgi:hypothetical protein
MSSTDSNTARTEQVDERSALRTITELGIAANAPLIRESLHELQPLLARIKKAPMDRRLAMIEAYEATANLSARVDRNNAQKALLARLDKLGEDAAMPMTETEDNVTVDPPTPPETAREEASPTATRPVSLSETPEFLQNPVDPPKKKRSLRDLLFPDSKYGPGQIARETPA